MQVIFQFNILIFPIYCENRQLVWKISRFWYCVLGIFCN